MTVRRVPQGLLAGGLVLGALALGLGCADSIVRQLAPENDPQVVDTPQGFEFTATDLRNVNQTLRYVWTNSAAQAALDHDSFLDHGYGVLVIHDATGQLVDSTLLELDLQAETRVGAPGPWTLQLNLAGARGRVHFILRPKP
jgi:hypothetical protein